MKCLPCGSDNPDSAVVCGHCGQPLGPPPPPPPGYPYAPGAPGKRAGTSPWLIVGLVVGGGCLLLLPAMGIAAAVLFPVFAQARGKAQQTSCLSNIRQLQTGVLSYAMDWDETHPPAAAWCDGIVPYTRNPQIFLCPVTGSTSQSDYWINRALDRAMIGSIVQPNQTVSLFEARNRWNGSGGSSDVDCRHNGGGHLAFVDGHARWLDLPQMSSATWSLGPPSMRGFAP